MVENSNFDTYLFEDRKDAYKALVEILPVKVMQHEKWVLIALSSGAVEIASKLSQRFELDFDLLFSEAILAPYNDECQLGMVSETNDIVIEEKLVKSFGIPMDFIYQEGERLFYKYIQGYQNRYRKGLPISDLQDRNILLIDEGCETGLNAMCALKSVINLGIKKVSLATPFLADDLFGVLDMKVDKIYTLHQIKDFIRVSYYYKDLPEIKPKKVIEILDKCNHFLPLKKGEV